MIDGEVTRTNCWPTNVVLTPSASRTSTEMLNDPAGSVEVKVALLWYPESTCEVPVELSMAEKRYESGPSALDAVAVNVKAVSKSAPEPGLAAMDATTG